MTITDSERRVEVTKGIEREGEEKGDRNISTQRATETDNTTD